MCKKIYSDGFSWNSHDNNLDETKWDVLKQISSYNFLSGGIIEVAYVSKYITASPGWKFSAAY